LIRTPFFYTRFFFFRIASGDAGSCWSGGWPRGLFVAIVLAAVKHDFCLSSSTVWFCSSLMVGVTLGLFFDYLPTVHSCQEKPWPQRRGLPSRLMNWLIMGQETTISVHISWPSIPWFQYNGPILANQTITGKAKGLTPALGLFETRHMGINFFYDIFLGIRSHKRGRSRCVDAAFECHGHEPGVTLLNLLIARPLRRRPVSS